MENGGRGGGKLKCIAIATGYHHRAMAMLLVGHGRGQKIVGLITRSFRIREAARRDEPRQHIQLIDELFVEMSTALIIRKEALAVGRRTERVPPDKYCARPLIFVQAQQNICEADDSATATIARPPDRFRQGMEGAMRERVAIHDEQGAVHGVGLDPGRTRAGFAVGPVAPITSTVSGSCF